MEHFSLHAQIWYLFSVHTTRTQSFLAFGMWTIVEKQEIFWCLFWPCSNQAILSWCPLGWVMEVPGYYTVSWCYEFIGERCVSNTYKERISMLLLGALCQGKCKLMKQNLDLGWHSEVLYAMQWIDIIGLLYIDKVLNFKFEYFNYVNTCEIF